MRGKADYDLKKKEEKSEKNSSKMANVNVDF